MNMNFLRAAGICLLGLGLTACGGDFESIDRSSSGEDGKVRLVNGTSQSTFLDLYESGRALQTSVALYTASPYSSLSTGNHTLSLRNSGDNATIATATVTSSRDDHQILLAYTSGGAIASTVLSESEPAPAANNAALRVVNTAASDGGNVDVYVVTTSCAANTTSTTAAVFSGLGNAPTAYVPVTASTTPYHVCVTAAGDRTALRTDIASLTFTERRIVTLVLVRTTTPVLKAVVVDQQGPVGIVTSMP